MGIFVQLQVYMSQFWLYNLELRVINLQFISCYFDFISQSCVLISHNSDFITQLPLCHSILTFFLVAEMGFHIFQWLVVSITLQTAKCLLGLCIGKNLAIRYVSRYRGCDTIYCDTVSKAIYWDISYIKKAVIKNTPPYANRSKIIYLTTVGSAFALISLYHSTLLFVQYKIKCLQDS